MYEHIAYTVEAGVAEVRLDRPDVLNAFTEVTIDELNAALTAAMADESVYSVVLTGTGRAFCAGVDTTHVGTHGEDEYEHAEYIWKVLRVLYLLHEGEKPTVAAINGPAIGGGFDFTLAADFRLVSEDAFLRDQHVDVGLVVGGSGFFLPRLVGESRAKEFMLAGRDITPEDARETGLAIEVVPDDELHDAAHEFARELRDKPAEAMRRSKAIAGARSTFDAFVRDEIDAHWACMQDPEHEEAVAAFNEGREPDFGRAYE